MIKKVNFRKILDIFIVMFLLITFIKRGGFYKSDVLGINLVLTATGIIYLCITSIISKRNIISVVSIFAFLLGITYFLPILFGNYADISDGIFEMVRYFNLYIVYKIVSESDNKNVYENGILVVTLFECIIGIDGIGNRYLSNILKIFSSGYLGKDFTRISGTIQYANVFACLCAVSLLILMFKLIRSNKNNFINGACFFFIFTSLILTESRAVITIFVIFLLYYIISSCKKENIKETIIITIVNIAFSIICATLIYNFAMSSWKIYIFTIVATLLNLLLNFILYKYDLKIKRAVAIQKVAMFLIAFIIVYSILAINISAPLCVSSDMNEKEVTRCFYNVQKNTTNNIKFKVDQNEIDTRYTIKLVQVLNDLEVKIIKEVGYFSSSTGTFDFEFKLDEDVKYIKMYVECEKGNITLRNMELNGKNIKLNYLLIPSSFIYRMQDILNGSTSITDRLKFAKDAFAIITSSVKNFVFGVGGEGFKNTYELYQAEKYISTEVHNSFLQIFVESGILGFSCICIITIYTIIKCKDKEKVMLILFFIIHSLVDLELSYFSMIFLLGILLGLCVDKKIFKLNINVYFQIPVILILVALFVVIFKANLAYGIVVDTNGSDNIAVQANVVKILEKRVMFDKYDVNYRMDLNGGYEKYLKILLKEYSSNNDTILQEEIKNVLSNMKINADTMMKNSKYNKYVIIDVSNIYFNNLYYFAKLYYPKNNDIGYEEYMCYILSNIEKLKEHKYNEIAINEVESLYNNYYTELKEKNKNINSLKIQEFIDVLEEKR